MSDKANEDVAYVVHAGTKGLLVCYKFAHFAPLWAHVYHLDKARLSPPVHFLLALLLLLVTVFVRAMLGYLGSDVYGRCAY